MRIMESKKDLTEIKFGLGEEILLDNVNLGRVEFPPYSQIVLRGKSSVELDGKYWVEVYDQSKVFLSGHSTAILHNRSQGQFSSESLAYLFDYSFGRFFADSKACLRDFSLGYFEASSKGYLFDNSFGVFFMFSEGILNDQSEALFFDMTKGKFYDSSKATLYDWSQGKSYNSEVLIASFGSKGHPRIAPYDTIRNLNEWLEWNGLTKSKKITLYKWVQKDYKDFYTGQIDYSKDEIVAPDWDPDYKRETGRGLHLAVDPWAAFSFHSREEGRMLKFEVPLEDIHYYDGPFMPYLVRVPKLKGKRVELGLVLMPQGLRWNTLT